MEREKVIKNYCSEKCHKPECKLKAPCKEAVWYADGYMDAANKAIEYLQSMTVAKDYDTTPTKLFTAGMIMNIKRHLQWTGKRDNR